MIRYSNIINQYGAGSNGFIYFNLCRYPFNNALHHHVESIILSCLESTNDTIINHLFQDCGLITKILQIDNTPTLSGELNQVIDGVAVIEWIYLFL